MTKAVLSALGERDEPLRFATATARSPPRSARYRGVLPGEHCEYFKREVLPHVPDAWIDESKTKVGYEIPLNRHFYCYEPPRDLDAIEADIKTLEGEIVALLREVTA